MPSPEISPRNWERTTIVCHFVMGKDMATVRNLSFQEQVSTIAAYPTDSYTQAAMKVEERYDGTSVYLSHGFGGTPDEPYQRRIQPTNLDRPYSPHVDDSLLETVYRAVLNENPETPPSKFNFENNLNTLLDAAECSFRLRLSSLSSLGAYLQE